LKEQDIKKLDIMLNMQEELNILTSGNNWKSKITNKGKQISWGRCIYMELCELIDSTSWKHWKSIEEDIDIDNILIELVDIWHFMLSKLLESNCKDEIINKIKKSQLKLDYKAIDKTNIKQNDILSCSDKFLQTLICNNDDMILINDFLALCGVCSLEYNWLYKLYIGKNALNKFRQDNGYKEGKYKKIWNFKGKECEDNIVMQDILQNSKDDTPTLDMVYSTLKDAYKN